MIITERLICVNNTLYIVLPSYNEEAVLHETSRQLLELMKRMRADSLVSLQSRIVFVDDGSKDKTWEIIDRLSDEYEDIIGIKLSKNVGHQNALYAGLMTVKDNCDCAISIDADLQDDIHAIPEMMQKFLEGDDIVYGIRKKRTSDSWFKRSSAVFFYKLMQMMGTDIRFNHADFRLMSKRSIEALAEFKERNLFLRGIVPMLGFKSSQVYYDRVERFAGESKYPFRKMLSFAFDGVTSFSVTPIRIITAFGAVVCLFSIIMAIYAFIQKITGHTSEGWASLMISIWFFGGVQLISLGLVGEYVGKIYRETKRRPRYIVEQYKNK